MRGEWNRKALSPLIATVLLIAFAAALGTMIMNWSVSSVSDETPCEEVLLELEQGGKAICYDVMQKHLKFIVRNKGEKTIEKVLVSATDSTLYLSEKVLEANMEEGRGGSFTLQYDSADTSSIGASITPIIISGDGHKTCSDKSLELMSVPLC